MFRLYPPLKMSKLAIAAETEEDKYDVATAVRCLDCDIDLDKTAPKLAGLIDGIMAASTFSRKEEVKAWEQELISCEHILLLNQQDSKPTESGDLGHCSKCDLKENLWLCLECGNLGCGRQQMGGVEGNSHGLAHALDSSHGVAVKLGSITPEGNADVYCYKCDEERIDDNLGQHLAHWGINIADRQKTEKSLTEMQIEQNLKWDFSMTTEDGKELKPLTGPGLTGLKNLGNSCYLASIIQCLFDLPAFKSRYFDTNDALPIVNDPASDLETQLRKMGHGLLSGRYSKPDSDAPTSDHSELRYQRGIAPAMLKHLVGRGHGEFSTMRQQDAFEFLQYIFTLIQRSNRASGKPDPTDDFRFVSEHRLQCLECKRVRYTTTEQDNIFVDIPKEKVADESGLTEGGESNPEVYRPVTLNECLDRLTAPEIVELACSACGSKGGFTKQFLDVPVIVPQGEFSFDEYMSSGLQSDEVELPDVPEPGKPAFVANPAAVEQLLSMGFSQNRCDRALHATGNSSADAAIEWLFAHMDDPNVDLPLDLAEDKKSGQDADPAQVEMLVAMGFGEPQAKKALRETGGDTERAVEWLFSHPDDLGLVEEDTAAPAEPSGAKELPGSSNQPAKYRLQSIVCHKGTSIHTGHYVAFIRKSLSGSDSETSWVLFNDEKVVEATDVDEMSKFAYVYFFQRV
ncbi:unnamed protein product [Parascedosporium putredinis]|uniref:Ubiquitin carboxyl-terminal hydrolase n=1 Tax=Parascedosporium putredinis TaxID=1442378 RepID=A0A9P1H1K6_9PEZI|nr:unnamed protein product [Parascedosporium putredinis]CAI7995244.1 unnamed protein product [Parascedosporium putredinis]